jgi:hypothetical protein
MANAPQPQAGDYVVIKSPSALEAFVVALWPTLATVTGDAKLPRELARSYALDMAVRNGTRAWDTSRDTPEQLTPDVDAGSGEYCGDYPNEHGRLQQRTAELQKAHDALTSPPRTAEERAQHTQHLKDLARHQTELSHHQTRDEDGSGN